MTEMPPPKLVATTKSYEELDGGQGREVFFRPHRYSAQDLRPLQAAVVLLDGGHRRECSVHDVSQNGAALEWSGAPAVTIGDRLRVEVLFDEYRAYSGEARVGSVREQDGSVIVGISFGDGALLDIDDVLNLRDIRGWQGRDGLGLSLGRKPWAVPGHQDFKVLVSELALFLQDSEQQLREMESHLPWHVVHGEQDTPARRGLIQRIERDFTAEVVRYGEAIDATLRQVSPGEVAHLKQFSIRQVQRYLMQSPCLHRAWQKPFGYPGDYEVMRFIYEHEFEGATLFAKAVQLSFLRSKASVAVRTRKDLMKRELRRILEEQRGSEQPIRLLSVAAGPAQELLELLHEFSGPCPPIEIVLFDQDKSALSYAYRRLTPVVDSRWAKRVNVLYLHDSIKRLLRDPKIFEEFGQFDAIFSVGLFDYLQGPSATVLCRNLYARVAEGGMLFIGNMVPDNPSRWLMEHHLDWYLIYRTRDELREIGRKAAPDAVSMQIVEEATGVNPFLQVIRG
jgi:extracellular factor (EF) 3-hydroxypalmitic acid methyl ester biosynthesis protein